LSTAPGEETAGNPYRGPSAATHEAIIDAQIDAAVAVHDRHPSC